MRSQARGSGQLLSRPIPDLIPEQVACFTLDSLRARPVRNFNPLAMLSAMQIGGNRTSGIAIDIGGDKLVWATFEVAGDLLRLGDTHVSQGDGGAGYLEVLEELAETARRNALTVGISLAGPIDGTVVLASPNLPVFTAELHAQYSGDFANVFDAVQVANDAEAGIMAAGLEAVRRYPHISNVIYLINGSGLGGAVLHNNLIFATEPGHVEVSARLNPFDQRKACGMLGSSHVCVEVVAASKAGIEDIWSRLYGKRLSGRYIAARYLNGDSVALELYDNSALVMAHVIKGFARAFSFPEDLNKTIIVGHGGIFEVPGYGDRLQSILATSLPYPPKILFTRDFSANTCLDGAAIAAVISRLAEVPE